MFQLTPYRLGAHPAVALFLPPLGMTLLLSLGCHDRSVAPAEMESPANAVSEKAAEPMEPPSESRTGVVVEEVAKGSALEKAGLQPGDLLLSWERPPNPPANPKAARGELHSPFDWMWLEIEQAPRGLVRLTGQRDSQPIRGGGQLVFEVAPGLWNADVRPNLSEELLALYRAVRERPDGDDLGTATEKWEKLASATEDPTVHAWIRFRLVEALARGGDATSAESRYRSLEPKITRLEHQVALACTMSETYWGLGDTARAEKAALAARSLASQAGEGFELHLALSLHRLSAQDFYSQGWQAAADLSLQALRLRRRAAPGSTAEADSLLMLGAVARHRGDLREARLLEQQALKLYEDLVPGSLQVAQILNNMGSTAAIAGDYVVAVELFRRSLSIAQEEEDDGPIALIALNNLGALFNERGDPEMASVYFMKVLENRQHLLPVDIADILSNLGDAAHNLGRADRSIDYLEEALEILQESTPRAGLRIAQTMNSLAIVYYDRGDVDRSVELLEAALAIAEETVPRSRYAAIIHGNLAQIMMDLGDLDGAWSLAQRALAIRRRLAPGSLQVAGSLHQAAEIMRARGLLQKAEEFYSAAVETVESQVGIIGASRRAQARYRAMHARYYRDAVEVLLELDRPQESYLMIERFHGQSLLAQLAERDLILVDLPQELDRKRRQLAADNDRLLTELADLAGSSDAERVEALHTELVENRAARDELEEEVREVSPRLAALRYPHPMGSSAARSALDPGTLLLSYSVGKDGSHLFIFSRKLPLRVYPLAISEESLKRQIESLTGQVHGRDWRQRSASRIELSKQLYRTLITPAEEAIAASERLVIIPDGPLHYLPFSALIGGGQAKSDRAWQYLVEWKPLHTVLSATVYAELKGLRREGGGSEPVQQAVAAFGDPLYPQKPHQVAQSADGEPAQLASADGDAVGDVYVRAAAERGFDIRPLPATREKVMEIAALYPRSKAYLGAEATEERVKALGKDVAIVHLAAHGFIDERFPLNSALALTIPEHPVEGQENGLLQAWEIFERVRLDADLVVLSACESAGRSQLDGEGLIGLSRAFQFAGARSVLASLWQVADPTTAALMQRFYRYLRDGKTKDEALRAAQLELIRGPIEVRLANGGTETVDASAPYYWAAFQLYGDWQ